MQPCLLGCWAAGQAPYEPCQRPKSIANALSFGGSHSQPVNLDGPSSRPTTFARWMLKYGEHLRSRSWILSSNRFGHAPPEFETRSKKHFSSIDPLPDLPSDRDWVSPPTATCRSSRTDQHPVRRLAMTLSMSMATVWKMTGVQEPSCNSQAWPPTPQHSHLCCLNLPCADGLCACCVCNWVELLQSSSRHSSFEECVLASAGPTH